MIKADERLFDTGSGAERGSWPNKVAGTSPAVRSKVLWLAVIVKYAYQ
jgi:hypothetical protein